MLAQMPHMTRGPGMYLNLFKFIPVVIIYILWAWTTNWVEHDTLELTNLRFAVWNSAVFFSGVLGLALVLAIPIYFIGLGLLLLAYFVPLLSYVYTRNQTVPDDQKVLTPYHLGEVCNDILHKLGMKRCSTGTSARSTARGRRSCSSARPRARPRKIRHAFARPRNHGRTWRPRSWSTTPCSGARPTSTSSPPPSSSRCGTGSTAFCTPPSRSTGRPETPSSTSSRSCRRWTSPRSGSPGRLLRRDAGQVRSLDFRVATSGSKAGEKLVMRILDNSSAVTKMEDLGMRPKLIEQVRGLVTQPHGMFLCCGPTGAGKSTTLYASLREIDRYQRNIITVEDPIEYQLDNITQMEVNTKAGQTFATSLRSILRQDPDVIMIGEIRDQETASIACQAANTGHMVFSTVHSNDAVTALFRLLDLGVEPFMIASALSGVLGQRLVRLLCEACKEPYKPKPEFLKKANLPADKVDVFYRRPENPEQVCPQCGGTGYFGRTGIYELLVLTEADARHDPREPVDQQDQGRGPQRGHDLSARGRPAPGDPGPHLDRRTAASCQNEPHANRALAKYEHERVSLHPAVTRSDPTSEVIRMKLLMDFIIIFLRWAWLTL